MVSVRRIRSRESALPRPAEKFPNLSGQGRTRIGFRKTVNKVEIAELNTSEERPPIIGECDGRGVERPVNRPEFVEVEHIEPAGFVSGRAPLDEGLYDRRGSADVDVAVDGRNLWIGQVTDLLGLLELQQGALERRVGHQEVVHEMVVVAFVDIGAGAGMPAEVVADGAAFRTLERGDAVVEGVLIHLDAGAVQDPDALVAIDEDVPRADRALRDFE